MLTKRLSQIMQILKNIDINTASVTELSHLCGVSEKTIRQDLTKLETMNLVTRVHGGAVLKSTDSQILSVTLRKQSFLDEKKSIAAASLSLIEDNDTIFLDSGTTTLELAKILNKDVIVITTDPAITNELTHHDNVTLYCTGGLVNRERGSYVFSGDDAIAFIRRYRTKKCFIGCSTIHFESGLMVYSSIEARIKKEIMNSSDQVICLADSSKFCKRAFTSFASLNEIQTLVTEYKLSDKDQTFLTSQGIQLITV